MYEMLGGKHPFHNTGDSTADYASALKKGDCEFSSAFSE